MSESNSKAADPELCVVIATHRREARLRFALEALARQTVGTERFEVVVVHSPDSPAAASAPAGLRVRFERAEVAAVGAQRNLGWRSSDAPLVVFTDDDCRPEPGWLAALSDAATEGATIVQGRTVPDPDELHLLHGHARSVRVDRLDPWLPSCNLLYPRELLERTGGFDPSFRGAEWGEDTDLGRRALALGASVRFAPDAIVRHAVHPRGLPAALGDAARRNALPRVLALHPEMREQLRWGVFLRAEGPHVWALIGGLGLWHRHRCAAIGLMAPWLARQADTEAGSPRALIRRLAHLPGQAAVDVVAAVATAARGLRHGVLVL